MNLQTIKWLNIWQMLFEFLDLVANISKVADEKCIIFVLKILIKIKHIYIIYYHTNIYARCPISFYKVKQKEIAIISKPYKTALPRGRALITAMVDECNRIPTSPQHPERRHPTGPSPVRNRPNQDLPGTTPKTPRGPKDPNISTHLSSLGVV